PRLLTLSPMRSTSAAHRFRLHCSCEKAQLAHRSTSQLVEAILDSFNSGRMDWPTASERLQVSRAHLYRLRTNWLRQRSLALHLSGGNHKDLWPADVQSFLCQIIPLSKPLNYAFLSDQVERRFHFKRSRAALSQFVEQHFPDLLARQAPGP